jgi:hypothetical protein
MSKAFRTMLFGDNCLSLHSNDITKN